MGTTESFNALFGRIESTYVYLNTAASDICAELYEIDLKNARLDFFHHDQRIDCVS